METMYQYLKTATATNDVNIGKLEEEIKESGIDDNINYINADDSNFYIFMDNPLDSSEIETLNNIVASHEHITTAEGLQKYLDDTIYPFRDRVMSKFAAENIAMGITQAGKTLDVLSLFEMPVSLGDSGRLVSLKGSFDTGSLYVSLNIIDYHIENISNYSDLSPFVTLERLQNMKLEIANFLMAGN